MINCEFAEQLANYRRFGYGEQMRDSILKRLSCEGITGSVAEEIAGIEVVIDTFILSVDFWEDYVENIPVVISPAAARYLVLNYKKGGWCIHIRLCERYTYVFILIGADAKSYASAQEYFEHEIMSCFDEDDSPAENSVDYYTEEAGFFTSQIG